MSIGVHDCMNVAVNEDLLPPISLNKNSGEHLAIVIGMPLRGFKNMTAAV